MADPFASALDALFSGPCAEAATYVGLAAGTVATRAILRRSDELIRVGDGQVLAAGRLIELPRSDIDYPENGARVDLAEASFAIIAEPKLDAEGLTWLCEVEELP